MESCSACHKGANEGSTAPTQERWHFLLRRVAGQCAFRGVSEASGLLPRSSRLPEEDKSARGAVEDSGWSNSLLCPKPRGHPNPNSPHGDILTLTVLVIFHEGLYLYKPKQSSNRIIFLAKCPTTCRTLMCVERGKLH